MLKQKPIPIIYLFLTVLTLAAFWQVNHCDFVKFDDHVYVTENTHIQNGITMDAVRWAFTTSHAANWHPLTWISHMADVQFFGLNPRRHHLTNLLFHIANTLLLFFVFHRMTGALWQSAFLAALFALHPLHVESVAWVAERKDVLSTLFWMLTMCAYSYYAEHPKLRSYLAVLVLFALGLMAKSMLVTLPFVLLLLDFWPLRRLEQVKSAVHEYRWTKIYPLLLEKIPLFALTVLSCIATYIAQEKGGAVASLAGLSLSGRIENAFISYVLYIGKMIWPINLIVYYPYSTWWPFWQISGAVLLIFAVTFAVAWKAVKFPYLAVGWFWYLGTLVPVIGIVQVGNQAMADRYSYIPLIGLFIMVAWGIPRLLEGWRYRKEGLIASSALVLSCLLIATWTQVGYWKNSIKLFDHALEVNDHNYFIYISRGAVYRELGNYTKAIEDYDRAIEISPQSLAYYNRGIAHMSLGKHALAIDDFSKAVEFNPKYAEAFNNRGISHNTVGNHTLAIMDYDRAIAINPDYAEAYNNRGVAYKGLGNYTLAIRDYDRAIEIDPRSALAYNNRGLAYSGLGKPALAIADHDKAIEVNPEYAEAYNCRGAVHDSLGDHSKAIADFDRAVEINPKFAPAYYNRAIAFGGLGDHARAIEDFDKAIAINPEYAKAYYNRGMAHGILGNHNQAFENLKTSARLGYEEAKDFLRGQGINW